MSDSRAGFAETEPGLPARVARGSPAGSWPSRPGSQPPRRPPPWPEDLTTREREVLDLLAEGESDQQIARSLGISLKTVQNHVSRILDKLQAADQTQAALRARGIPPQPRL